MKPVAIILTCEHPGNEIPQSYSHYFLNAQEALQSHRGWDPGSKQIGQLLSKNLKAPLFITETSRLLVECNRSVGQSDLFSEFTVGLSSEEKEEILNQYYHPHRNAVTTCIERLVETSRVLHLSIHTFTPIWNGEKRKTDIGLLFDERREPESDLCSTWQDKLLAHLSDFQVDFNKPYLGSDDGFTTHLRTQFDWDDYLGIEIEVNQKFKTEKEIKIISRALSMSLLECIPK